MTHAQSNLHQHSFRTSDLGPAGVAWPSVLGQSTLAEDADTDGRMSSEPVGSDGALPRAIGFGRFTLLTYSRELLADGAPVPLGSRAIDVLFALIEGRGLLVTKDELLTRVWPTTCVEENSLQFQISTLRKALGEDRDFIRTVSGRGYRFVAELTTPAPRARAHQADAAFEGVGREVAEVPGSKPHHNVPAATSDLIGREVQLEDIAALVSANRLVTLVGAGGIGKTRLALELGRRVLEDFADGVWIVELGPLSDPALVLPAIASTLGLDDTATSPNGLAKALGSKRMLLVLDNCEHLIGAAAVIVEALLHANASLQVVATSREPLRAEAEWVYRVPSLDVPPEAAEEIAELMRHSAARLFIARTFAAEPGSHADTRIGAAAAKICRRLDGIPLAIELAAATAAALGVEWLASRVDDQLSLLTDGRRTAPTRQQTLRGTLDWSYDLLSEAERAVMRRLAVFGGDFTMEEASAVAANDDVAASQVPASVANLVTKSLVVRDDSQPTPRFRLLQTMRAYAMSKLTESGEFDSVAQVYA
ncbi:MAG: transcriptional regulator [Phenylobacterium sp.]|jgi:predicted ATPase/DNA-binding winged helix-turn-helix (wHTH) protein|nr:transcriptional regulator [Phenylobacterium sp.]MDB5463833.1 transcriptional regulator [Phenylobacterium sp.]